MDAGVAEQLRRYSRGETTSRAVRDATGLNYSQVLDGLGQLLREHLLRNVDADAAELGPAEPSSNPVQPAPRGSCPC